VSTVSTVSTTPAQRALSKHSARRLLRSDRHGGVGYSDSYGHTRLGYSGYSDSYGPHQVVTPKDEFGGALCTRMLEQRSAVQHSIALCNVAQRVVRS
jgi:hypothetical protein